MGTVVRGRPEPRAAALRPDHGEVPLVERGVRAGVVRDVGPPDHGERTVDEGVQAPGFVRAPARDLLHGRPLPGDLDVGRRSWRCYQPSEQWLFDLRGTYSGFSQASDGRRLYDYAIYRAKTTYQWNRYLFFRGIGEYNSYRRQLLTDFLASFTYIPGTVFHVGYGSLYEKVQWQDDRFVPGRDLLETRRGFFVKASYLWRL